MRTYLVYDKSHNDLLREEKCRIILTFANLKSENDIPNGFPGILIDSGGYQLQTGVLGKRGKTFGMQKSTEITISGYADLLEFILPEHPEIEGYFNIDILGDLDKTLDNQDYLEKRGFNPIPVWHPNDGDWVLDYYCSEYSYVAIGALVGKKMAAPTIRKVFERVKFKHPDTKFHVFGLGIGASTVLRSFRPYSVDYSTWVNCYKFGHGLIWDKDGLLREKALPKEVRDRIRIDKEFKKEVVRDVLKKIKIFGERIEQMNDPHQLQIGWRI